jgi:biopolymer transport protein ExbD
MKQIIYKFSLLSVALVSGLTITACGFANENTTLNKESGKNDRTKSDTPKPIEIPSGVKKPDFESNPNKDALSLTLNSRKQLYYQDKVINDATLKDVLKESAAKTKKLSPEKSMPSYLLSDDKVNPFYLKADVELPFSEVIKILKTVKESSPNEYRVKFIVNPAEEVLKNFADKTNPMFVLNIDLGTPVPKTDIVPKPNPLLLVARLDASGKVKLDSMMMPSEPPMEISELKERLTKIFKQREQNKTFIEGTMEIEKKVILLTDQNVKYGDVVKLLDELYDISAKPVVLGDLFADDGKNGSGSGIGSGSGSGSGSGNGNKPKP